MFINQHPQFFRRVYFKLAEAKHSCMSLERLPTRNLLKLARPNIIKKTFFAIIIAFTRAIMNFNVPASSRYAEHKFRFHVMR